MEHKTLTWTQVLKSPYNEVIVESYGYTERSSVLILVLVEDGL
jgi:hypothetical protein